MDFWKTFWEVLNNNKDNAPLFIHVHSTFTKFNDIITILLPDGISFSFSTTSELAACELLVNELQTFK